MECEVCKQHRTAVFKCDICKLQSCKSCGQLTSSEVKVLELTSRVLKFYCVKCREHEPASMFQLLVQCKDELIDTKEAVISTKDCLIESLKEQIVQLKGELGGSAGGNQRVEQDRLKYNEVVAGRKKSSEVLVVKPKRVQESIVTRTQIEEKIDPGAIKAGVSKMKFLRDGAVAISCERKEDLVSVSDSIRRQFGGEFEIKIPEKRCPRIKIINVEEKMLASESDFIEKIVLQNAITTTEAERKISVVTHFKGKRGKESVVLEVDSCTYSLIQKKEKLSIGWRSYTYFDHINIVQCFRCYKFGHMAKDCKSEKNVCPKCTGDHKVDICQSQQIVCTNCKFATDVLRVPNIDCNHLAFDKNCETYKRIYRELEQKVSYPGIYPSQR